MEKWKGGKDGKRLKDLKTKRREIEGQKKGEGGRETDEGQEEIHKIQGRKK